MDTRDIPGPWRALLETAVLTPSPHNVQPWRFRVAGPSEADLLIERRRTLPKEDVEGSFIILTMGMVVETLALAASHRGLALDVTPMAHLTEFSAARLAARSEPLVPFARLALRPDPTVRAEVPLELFERRRTSRLPYRRDPVAAEHVALLAERARGAGHSFTAIVDPPRIERILGWNVDAVFEDLNHPPYRDEMRLWLRYSYASSERTRDGLDFRCMNVSPLELWFAFHASGLLEWPPTSAWFRRRYRDQIGPVTTLGLLSGPFWDPRDAFGTGRFLMRFWLECARFGYVIHPYGNLVTNRPIAARVAADTGLDRVWLVFKIGRSDEPPRSRRRPVDDVLVDASSGGGR